MNNNRGNNRRRGRGNNNRPQGGGQQLNRIDSRARGNAPQMLEKYRKLAQDAHLNGDRVQAEYYLPQRHGGTLMCHQAHRADGDPLVDVGRKDITAHVNFTGIAVAAQGVGLDVLGYTSQARFLMNCGLMGLLEGAGIPAVAHAQKLITEHEMGELFKVIGFARGCDAAFNQATLGFAAGDRTHTL